MMFIKLSTGDFPLYEGDIRLENPEMGEQLICPADYALVEELPQPVIDVTTQNILYDKPFQENSVWKVGFVIQPMPPKAIDEWNAKPSERETNPVLKKIMQKIEAEQGA
jgi:hypothetical protein